jgi:NAD(P)-dependent dehydrogenase (short-subunit alcohol dehydrogenase family)
MKKGTILVLGASGAVGSAVCRQLIAAGHPVVAAARDPERLRAAVGELDVPRLWFEATDSKAVQTAVEDAVNREPRGLAGVVNCVGSLLLKPAHSTSMEEWSSVLRTNLDSAFLAVKHGAAAMLKSGGSIVLVSSAAASSGMTNHEAIAAAKAGVEGLTRSAAASYAARNIRVNAVAPGLVRSGLTEPVFSNPLALKASEAMHALPRLGEPDDVAGAITWLLESEWVTGQVIGVDGGLARVRPRAKA